MQQDEDEDS